VNQVDGTPSTRLMKRHRKQPQGKKASKGLMVARELSEIIAHKKGIFPTKRTTRNKKGRDRVSKKMGN